MIGEKKMSVKDAVIFVIGFICGMSFVMVVTCLALSGRINEQKEVEKNMENVRKEGSK